jgi:NitT/TauT family transport system substrate-binding protein
MKNTKSILSILCLLLAVTTLFCACSPAGSNGETTTTEATSETEEKIVIDTDLEIKISVLNGTTGFGAAQIMNNAKDNKSVLNYNFTVETDASNITAGLINGSIDIAALPTNAAATVYNKTGGGIQIAAINTLGVLYLMVNGDKVTINDIKDLEGKTVYCLA